MAAGFVDIDSEDTGSKYLAALALADQGELPPLGQHVLIGPTAPEKMRNSARNIEQSRPGPVSRPTGSPCPDRDRAQSG